MDVVLYLIRLVLPSWDSRREEDLERRRVNIRRFTDKTQIRIRIYRRGK